MALNAPVMNTQGQTYEPVPGETQLPMSATGKSIIFPIILLLANHSLDGKDATDIAATLFNTEEFINCNGKKFNIDKYLQAGAEVYAKCFLYLHSGSKPCFMHCASIQLGAIRNRRLQPKVIKIISYDITPRPYKERFYRAVLYCFRLIPQPFPEIDGKCDAARYVVGCLREQFRIICNPKNSENQETSVAQRSGRNQKKIKKGS